MDGSQKLPQRLLGTVGDRLRAGQPIDRLALAVGAWIHYLRGRDESGLSFDIQDPLADALAQQLTMADQASSSVADPAAREQCRVEAFCAYAPVFGALGNDARLAHAVARHTRLLRERGVMATLEACA